MHVPVDDRDPFGAMVPYAHGARQSPRWLKKQKPMARSRLGMVAGRPHGARRFRAAAHDGIDCLAGTADRGQRRLQRLRRHDGVGVEAANPLGQARMAERVEMRQRMAEQHRLLVGHLGLLAQKRIEARLGEHGLDGDNALRPLGMAEGHQVAHEDRAVDQKRRQGLRLSWVAAARAGSAARNARGPTRCSYQCHQRPATPAAPRPAPKTARSPICGIRPPRT